MAMPESDRKIMKAMAKNFKEFLDIVDSKLIIEGITQDQYDDARKQIKKLIKELKKGDENALDLEKYYQMKESGMLDI